MPTDIDAAPGPGPDVTVARSLLFVPGDRSDRFDKAAASGADLVVCDLEDAVAADHKATAREEVVRWLSGRGAACVRINAADTGWYEGDWEALAGLPGLRAVMVAKAEDPQKLTDLSEALGGRTPVVALIETALGVHRAFEIARAQGVSRLAFGAIDFAFDIAASDDDSALLYARSTLVLKSRAARISPPIDGVTTTLDAPAAKADAAKARQLGFGGKLCVHPRQVAAVNAAFTPSAEQVRQAGRVVTSLRGGAVAQLDGQMIDKPVVDRARTVLLRAQLLGAPSPHEEERP